MFQVKEVIDEGAFGYRRKTERHPCSLDGVVALFNNKNYGVQCHDLSLQGIGISGSVPLPINSQIEVTISNAKISTLSLKGRVCWCKQVRQGIFRAGIAFNAILPFKLSRII